MTIENDYYGKINFIGANGEVAETIDYKSKADFEKEIKDSNDCGRPITYEKFEKDESLEKLKNSVQYLLNSLKETNYSQKYPDDLDDYTNELMNAIVGEKNMIFERRDDINDIKNQVNDAFKKIQFDKNKLEIEEDKFEKGNLYFNKMQNSKYKDQTGMYENKIKELGFEDRNDYELKLKDFQGFKDNKITEISSNENELKEINKLLGQAERQIAEKSHREIIDLYKDEYPLAENWDMNMTKNIKMLNEREGRVVPWKDINSDNVIHKNIAEHIINSLTKEMGKSR